LGRFIKHLDLGYAHDLDDGDLHANLRWLMEQGVLTAEFDSDERCFRMAPVCGKL
jgi:hypothetical protein